MKSAVVPHHKRACWFLFLLLMAYSKPSSSAALKFQWKKAEIFLVSLLSTFTTIIASQLAGWLVGSVNAPIHINHQHQKIRGKEGGRRREKGKATHRLIVRNASNNMKSVSIQLSFGARKRVQQQCGVKHKYRR
jgi:hypothetical protein